MHELTMTEDLLKIALSQAAQAHAARITELHLVVGQLAGVTDESVQFYWQMISQGTPAEGARLHFRNVPAEWQCHTCGGRFTLENDTAACPQCGGAQVILAAGEEFYLEAIEVET
ncbi:MAG TPA: hydrogenase maturation nickel metallochaperone HypA [Anaerolineae bacterium]|nr:hydrogenase maturation nickel metallochaperone HypA [Anaerolineae bacterium]